MFHKAPDQLNRGEKERFEAGATARRALVAKLAMRLVGKVRQLQSSRAHHAASNVTHKPGDHTVTAANTQAVLQAGAS